MCHEHLTLRTISTWQFCLHVPGNAQAVCLMLLQILPQVQDSMPAKVWWGCCTESQCCCESQHPSPSWLTEGQQLNSAAQHCLHHKHSGFKTRGIPGHQSSSACLSADRVCDELAFAYSLCCDVAAARPSLAMRSEQLDGQQASSAADKNLVKRPICHGAFHNRVSS